MSDYIETKTSSDYVLKYLHKFQVPMIREIDRHQSEEICKEIDLIRKSLEDLKIKLKETTK
jgi:hypothetical protein